jgi:hypothetical protein
LCHFLQAFICHRYSPCTLPIRPEAPCGCQENGLSALGFQFSAINQNGAMSADC